MWNKPELGFLSRFQLGAAQPGAIEGFIYLGHGMPGSFHILARPLRKRMGDGCRGWTTD